MTRLRCGDELFEPVVREKGDTFEVTLGDRTFRFALVGEGPGVFVLQGAGRTVRFHLARQGPAVHLFWDGSVYELAEEREGTRPARRRPTGRGSATCWGSARRSTGAASGQAPRGRRCRRDRHE